MNDSKKSVAFRQGIIVLVVLAVLTGAEYWVSIAFPSGVFLAIIAVIKAAIIIQYFMHISRLWSEEVH